MDLVFPDWLCSKFNSFRTRQDSAIFRKEATQVLATHESSLARAITIEETYKRLRKLSVKQDDLVRQALRCTEHKLFRAAYVLAWARPMDFLKEKLALDMPKLNSARPNWKVKTIEDLRDVGSDYQILEALRDLSLCTKVEEKALKGLLSRNECAHPIDYYPGLNETLGYTSEILRRIESFQKRWS